MFVGSIYCTLFLLDCFDIAYGCIFIWVYSVTLFIAFINLCLYLVFLQFYRVFLFSPFFFLLLFFFLFLIILSFNFFKPSIFFLHLCLCLPFLLFFSPCSWSLMYIYLHRLPLFNFAYLVFIHFLSFLSSQQFFSFIFIALFPSWHLA